MQYIIIGKETDMKKTFEASVQVIYFLLKTFGEIDKLKLVKIIYFADKRHLIFGGRTITGDTYMAMKYGPVGSMVLNVLDRNVERLESEQLQYIDRYIQQGARKYSYKCTENNMVYDQLSESDKKTLTKIGEKFNIMDGQELVKLTHKYPEWSNFEEVLRKEPNTCKQIALVDLFSSIDNDPLEIPPDIIKDSRMMYLGHYAEAMSGD
jgi:uncharacterized phage-associated protein